MVNIRKFPDSMDYSIVPYPEYPVSTTNAVDKTSITVCIWLTFTVNNFVCKTLMQCSRDNLSFITFHMLNAAPVFYVALLVLHNQDDLVAITVASFLHNKTPENLQIPDENSIPIN
uniref:Uncharacterized protein n=1 Tax=Glossina austeni TaxID=7395 RepID=A0A1A9VDY0_GLOAU